MALVEIAPAETRGLLTFWFAVFFFTTQMVSQYTVYACLSHISPSNLQWQIPFGVQPILPAILIVASFFVCESPRWLYLTGRSEKAWAQLCKLRGLPDDHPYLLKEWADITAEIDHDKAEFGDQTFTSILREMFCTRTNLRRLQLICASYALAQLSGSNAVTSYLPQIFKLIGITSTEDSLMMTGLFTLGKLLSTIVASLFFIDALGRRRSMFTGIGTQVLCLIYLGVYLIYFLKDPKGMSKASGRAAVAIIYIYGFGWSVGKFLLALCN